MSDGDLPVGGATLLLALATFALDVAAARSAGMKVFADAAMTPGERLVETDRIVTDMMALPGLVDGG